jgi:WXG100 family type VII secretion target
MAAGARITTREGTYMAITVDAATLHKAANDTRSTRTEVEGDLGRLRSLAEELAGQWRGTAASGFQGLIARFNEDAMKLQQALGEIADLLDKEANAHQANDEQQSQMMNKFTNVLNP